MPLTLVKAPAAEPVSLPDAKAWLRVDGTDEDSLLAALIPVARQAVEGETGVALIAQQWKWSLDAWPPGRVLAPPIGPLRSLDLVEVGATSGSALAVPLASFRVDASGLRGRIALVGTVPDPGRAIGGIALTITVGLAAGSADVPAALRHAVLLTLASLHANRGDVASADGPVPQAARALLAPWRSRGL
jgi:uncharacterized phiE125 gp8 family phage protein